MNSSTIPVGFPNFLIIGASKCGTSSLYSYLRQHPEIYLSNIKESHYFTLDEIYNLGVDNYLKIYFPGSDGYKAIGDITPTYLIKPETVLPRLSSVYGDAYPKIIVILRNPIERAYSHYLHMVRSGDENESFHKALDLEITRMKMNPEGWWGYRSGGDYKHYINKWLECVPKTNFLFLLTEELSQSPESVLQKIFMHLNVDHTYVINDLARKNTGGSIRSRWLMKQIGAKSRIKEIIKSAIPIRTRQKIKSSLIRYNTKNNGNNIILSDELRAILKDHYSPEIPGLERITGLDLSIWGIGN